MNKLNILIVSTVVILSGMLFVMPEGLFAADGETGTTATPQSNKVGGVNGPAVVTGSDTVCKGASGDDSKLTAQPEAGHEFGGTSPYNYINWKQGDTEGTGETFQPDTSVAGTFTIKCWGKGDSATSGFVSFTLTVVEVAVSCTAKAGSSPEINTIGVICSNAQNKYKRIKWKATIKPEGTTATVTTGNLPSGEIVTVSNSSAGPGGESITVGGTSGETEYDFWVIAIDNNYGDYEVDITHTDLDTCTVTDDTTGKLFKFEFESVIPTLGFATDNGVSFSGGGTSSTLPVFSTSGTSVIARAADRDPSSGAATMHIADNVKAEHNIVFNESGSNDRRIKYKIKSVGYTYNQNISFDSTVKVKFYHDLNSLNYVFPTASLSLSIGLNTNPLSWVSAQFSKNICAAASIVGFGFDSVQQKGPGYSAESGQILTSGGVWSNTAGFSSPSWTATDHSLDIDTWQYINAGISIGVKWKKVNGTVVSNVAVADTELSAITFSNKVFYIKDDE
jgi:hypothetical protein